MKKELKTEEERIAYNCRKATFLIEKKQSAPLTGKEKMELQLHLAGCYICRVYENQSILINKMMHNFFNHAGGDAKLDDEFKMKMQKKIDQKMKNK